MKVKHFGQGNGSIATKPEHYGLDVVNSYSRHIPWDVAYKGRILLEFMRINDRGTHVHRPEE